MLDRLGIVGSVVCAIHCALPVVLGFISPSISSWFGNEWIHYTLLFMVIPLALVSFFKSRKAHHQNAPLILGVLGVSILVAAIKLENALGGVVANFELFATLLGSATLIVSHFLNIQMLRKLRQT